LCLEFNVTALQLDISGLDDASVVKRYEVGRLENKGTAATQAFRSWVEAQPSGEIFSDYKRCGLAVDGLIESRDMAQSFRSRFKNLVVLGIGGSALGAQAVIEALSWTVAQSERRAVYFVDNLDPILFEEIWAKADPKDTAYVVISKSGGTLETASQLTVVLERLEKANLAFEDHVLAITDPQKGVLRAWAANRGLKTLSVPPGVGGRFSVFTPVGLFAISFFGIDVGALMNGAQEQWTFKSVSFDHILRLAQRLIELELSGFETHMLMPYASKLRAFGDWYVQLWGESLGKSNSHHMIVGSTPLRAIGATDQHSILQLLVEGPERFVVGFLKINQFPQMAHLPSAVGRFPPEFADQSFAYGRSFAEILAAQLEGTQGALRTKGRPTYLLSLEDLGPKSIGALMAFYMDLTSLAGAFLEVNPYNQPGVELGKKLTEKILKQH
jgi:glucose-6-phosphate isomerase